MDDAAHVARYRAERDKALETIRKIDEDGWQFFEAQGNEPLRDVTDERRADQRRVAEMMEGLATAWERQFMSPASADDSGTQA